MVKKFSNIFEYYCGYMLFIIYVFVYYCLFWCGISWWEYIFIICWMNIFYKRGVDVLEVRG